MNLSLNLQFHNKSFLIGYNKKRLTCTMKKALLQQNLFVSQKNFEMLYSAMNVQIISKNRTLIAVNRTNLGFHLIINAIWEACNKIVLSRLLSFGWELISISISMQIQVNSSPKKPLRLRYDDLTPRQIVQQTLHSQILAKRKIV